MDKNEPLADIAAPAARRRVLQMMGTAAVAVPVLGLSACGGDSGGSASSGGAAPTPEPAAALRSPMAEMADSTTAAEDDMAAAADEVGNATDGAIDEMQESAEAMVDEVEQAADTIASDMPQVDENGPQAMGLAYRHDASTVDATRHTRYESGQQCANCVLFQGGDQAWGGCPLFAGKAVKRTGWCSAYSAAG
jgi:ribosomal protein S12 methylthiotransferase accessory factor YcaO